MRRARPVWAVVAAACAAVALASVVGSVATGMGWWEWSYARTGPTGVRGVSLARGGVHFHEAGFLPMLGGIPIVGNFFTIRVESPGWWFRALFSQTHKELVVPMWAIGLLAGGAMVVARRRATRVKKGHCARCSYDLKGLAAGTVCPECGSVSGER